MLSNVTKSADCLRGNTELQDLWEVVEKERPHKGRPPPRVLQDHIMIGKVMNEEERRWTLERLAHERQQRTNFYLSPQTQNMRRRKSRVPLTERKETQSRLFRSHSPPRPKSRTNLGFVAKDGTPVPHSPLGSPSPKVTPKSKAKVSPATVEAPKTASRRGQPRFEGLTRRDWLNDDWKPTLPYRPAHQPQPWEHVEGFAASTRTLERRKLNPNLDINSFQANKASAAALHMEAWVRPIEASSAVKGCQAWKETLREDFARDDDNYSSNAHDAGLDMLRKAMGVGPGFVNLDA